MHSQYGRGSSSTYCTTVYCSNPALPAVTKVAVQWCSSCRPAKKKIKAVVGGTRSIVGGAARGESDHACQAGRQPIMAYSIHASRSPVVRPPASKTLAIAAGHPPIRLLIEARGLAKRRLLACVRIARTGRDGNGTVTFGCTALRCTR
jgi:hypothetical protein